MKANELMVGDFIRTIYAQKIIKVREIKQSCIYTNNNGYEYNEIEPIPLTNEILEKNGFEVTHNMSSSRNKDVWSLRVSKYKVFHIIEHHNKRQFPYFWIEIGSNSDIKYVHQLQHALRLCGIEKEIILQL